MSLDRQKTVDRYLTCARQIAREFAPKRKGQKIVYVVVSEDAGMARVMETQEEWEEEVITPNWRPFKNRYPLRPSPPLQKQQQQHQQDKEEEQHQKQSTSSKTLTKQQQRILENWVLSKTDYQVVSDQSDFAKVAVWRTRREGRSIVIRENPAVEKWMMRNSRQDGYVDMLDCGTLLNNLLARD